MKPFFVVCTLRVRFPLTLSGNMAVVSVTNIRVLNNPCPLTDPFLFEIHFEAQQPLQQDVEWRVVYVGSGEHHSAAVQHRTSSSSSNGSSAQANGGSSTCIANKRSSNGAGDYVLDSVLLGPIECGALAFEFAVDAPDFTKVRKYLKAHAFRHRIFFHLVLNCGW